MLRDHKRILVWNVRRSSSSNFFIYLTDLISDYKPSIVILLEAPSPDDSLRRLCTRHGFSNFQFVDAMNQRGGIWYLWKHPVRTVDFISTEPALFHSLLKLEDGEPEVVLTAMHAPSSSSSRTDFWNRLAQDPPPAQSPWLVVGDLNTVTSASEKRGGRPFRFSSCRAYFQFTDASSLIDLGFSGPSFTWSNGRVGGDNIQERLDRVLANPSWLQVYPHTQVRHLPQLYSDHCPLLISLKPPSPYPTAPFRGLIAWTEHSDFKRFFHQVWSPHRTFIHNIHAFRAQAPIWHKCVYGNIGAKKQRIRARLAGIQKALGRGTSPILEQLQTTLSDLYSRLSHMEHVTWAQRARWSHVVLKDINTKYFHMLVKIHQAKSFTHMLKNELGQWVHGPTEISDLVTDYFRRFFGSTVPCTLPVLSHVSPSASPFTGHPCLDAPFTLTELRTALFSIQPSKAPGPDGVQAHFFQREWDLIHPSLLELVNRILQSPLEIQQLNHTLLSLIPKKAVVEHVADFRPISLCNTSYKIISKLIVHRIKPFLNDCISPSQSSFIPGRSIVDNILLVKEIAHSIASSKKNIKPMAIKVDLSKAYDSLEWSFIQDTLNFFQVPSALNKLIMSCITTCTMQVLWHGHPGAQFHPLRGIRQGDPLSPYIFTLCMERLSRMIQYEVDQKRWIPFQLRNFQASHIFYADDVVLFGAATLGNLGNMIATLRKFGQASGLHINILKSRLIFPKTLHHCLRRILSHSVRIPASTSFGKYLGVPLTTLKPKTSDYEDLLIRFNKKLAGWQGRYLNFAGRVTLIQTVLAALPVCICNPPFYPLNCSWNGANHASFLME